MLLLALTLAALLPAVPGASGPFPTPSADSFAMPIVAYLPMFAIRESGIPCGDLDRDGLQEVYARCCTTRVVYAAEHTGGFEFSLTDLGVEANVLWTIFDTDRDGLGELLLGNQDSLFYIEVRESPDSASYPTRLAWSLGTQPGYPYKYTVVADLDADSAIEIVILSESLCHRGVDIYENTGDDQYSLRATVPSEQAHPLAYFTETHDLDGDGLPELAAGQWWGDCVNFFEATGNDSFTSIGLVSLNGPDGTVTGIAATPDLDHDGRPEVFVQLMHYMGAWSKLAVIESPADNQFEVVWDTLLNCSGFTGNVVVGDVDGDSIPEIALGHGNPGYLFRCTGSDRYEVVWKDEPAWRPFALHDIDGDGRDELIHRVMDSTGRYEWLAVRKYVSLGVAEREAARLRAVGVSPSVLRPGTRLHLSGLPPDAKVELLDVSGRVRVCPDLALGIRDLSLRPGAYFVRITSGSQSITRKVLVVE